METQEITEDKEVNIDIETQDDDSVVATINPNVGDQLANASDATDGEEDKSTPEERLEKFYESNPDAKEYSNGVKKRINTLTYKMHEEERQKQAALDFAEGLRKENEKLRATQVNQGTAFLTEQKNRLTAEISTAKQLYKEAHMSNDAELLAEATANLTGYQTQLSNVEGHLSRATYAAKQQNAPKPPQENQGSYQQPAATQRPSQPQRPAAPDEKAQAWAEKNEWFGDDQVMTNAALTLHRQLINAEGYIPSSDGYYEELDQRMRKNFPTKFKSANSSVQVTPGGNPSVTPVGNTPNAPRSKKKTVTLTASQVSVARKLGVPLEEYAKYV